MAELGFQCKKLNIYMRVCQSYVSGTSYTFFHSLTDIVLVVIELQEFLVPYPIYECQTIHFESLDHLYLKLITPIITVRLFIYAPKLRLIYYIFVTVLNKQERRRL